MRAVIALALVFLVGLSLGQFPKKTDILYNRLNSCYSKAKSDIDCIEGVQDALEKLSDTIEKIHQLRELMKKVDEGFVGLNGVTSIAKYVPGIGSTISALSKTIKTLKKTFDSAYKRVKSIDDKIYKWKPKVDKGVKVCKAAIIALKGVRDACKTGRNVIGPARDCIDGMPDGDTLKTNLGSAMETLSGSLNSQVNSVNQVLGRAGSACSAIDNAVSIVIGWPDIGPVLNPFKRFYNALKPIINFFGKIYDVLKKKICIRIIKKFCFSVKKLIDGVKKLFKKLVKSAEKLLDKLLDKLPSFSLPGLPNFSRLFDININFNLPDINFNINFLLFFRFTKFSWRCPLRVTSICKAGSGSIQLCSSG